MDDRYQSVQVSASLHLVLDNSTDLRQLWTDWVSPLMQFLLLCHGETDRISRLYIRTDRETDLGNGITKPESFEWVQGGWRGVVPVAKSRYVGHHLLPFHTLSEKFQEVIANWFKLYGVARYPLMQHFSPQLSESEPFLEEKYASRIRSLEAFHRDVHGGNYMDPDDFQAVVSEIREKYRDVRIDDGRQDLGDFFKARLQYANSLSLKKRLDLLLDDSGCLLNDDEEAWRKGHRAMVSTRDSLVHSSNFGDQMSLDQVGHSLEYLDELFKASVLRALGFDYHEVDEALRRPVARRFRPYAEWSFDPKFRTAPDAAASPETVNTGDS